MKLLHDFGGLLCYTDAATCIHGDVRLVGWTSPDRGRVEICLFNMWGTVCGHYWHYQDARVVCRQLGYSGSSKCSHMKLYLSCIVCIHYAVAFNVS